MTHFQLNFAPLDILVICGLPSQNTFKLSHVRCAIKFNVSFNFLKMHLF